jgi:UDP-N-acetyl-D-mannosaminuronate dehydrogenase
VVGVTYKPDVADIRESPALEIIDELAAAGAQVAFCDPWVESLDTRHAGRLIGQQDPGKDAWDLVLIHTRHADVDHDWLASHPTVLDTTHRS